MRKYLEGLLAQYNTVRNIRRGGVGDDTCPSEVSTGLEDAEGGGGEAMLKMKKCGQPLRDFIGGCMEWGTLRGLCRGKTWGSGLAVSHV